MIAQKAVDVIEDSGRIRAQGHPGERALEHGGKQRGAESFAGNVGDQKSSAIVAQRKDVEVVSPYGQARIIDAIDREMRVLAEVAREQRLLNAARDVELFLHALTFALALDQSRVIQNAGGVRGEGIENLTVQLREGRGAPRIE